MKKESVSDKVNVWHETPTGTARVRRPRRKCLSSEEAEAVHVESECQERKSPTHAIPNFNIYFRAKGKVCPKTGHFVESDRFNSSIGDNSNIISIKGAWKI